MRHLKRFNESSTNRTEMIEMIVNTSDFDEDDLLDMSDKELKDLYDSLEVEEWEEELSIVDNMMMKSSFKTFSKLLGIDSKWLSDYLLECFQFNLDQSEMPFSDDEFEMILQKLEKLNED